MKDITKKTINAVCAGVLVLLGAFTGGIPSLNSVFIALIAGTIVAVTQFKEAVNVPRGKKASIKLFNFLAL